MFKKFILLPPSDEGGGNRQVDGGRDHAQKIYPPPPQSPSYKMPKKEPDNLYNKRMDFTEKNIDFTVEK